MTTPLDPTIPTHPVQLPHRSYSTTGGVLNQAVTLRAYEVYCHVYAPQPALITDGCRGGFSVGEVIAFLYAHSFPQVEWRDRVDEAFRNMRLGVS